MRRVVVVGCCGAGKSTLSAALASALDVPYVERDTLGAEGSDEFRAAAAAAVAADGWVFDGAPYYAEDLVYPRAQMVVGLDYPKPVVMRRVVLRSLRLTLTRSRTATHHGRPLREWLDPEHHVRWAWAVWAERRQEIAELASRPELAEAQVVRLGSPAAAEAWLSALRSHQSASASA